MAVQHPITEVFRLELDITRLRYSNQHRVFRSPPRFGLPARLCTGDEKRISVQMNRVMVHAEIHHPDPHAAAMTHHERRGVRTRLSVEGQPVELHVGGIGDIAVG